MPVIPPGVRRPPFRIDGRIGRLRYVDHRGRRRAMTGRLTFLVNTVWLRNVAWADQGTDYEITLHERGPWHRIHATQAEAREILEANRGPGQFLPWLRGRAS